MKWSGTKAFGKSPTVKFVVDGSKAGSLNSYGPLSFLKVCVQACILELCDTVNFTFGDFVYVILQQVHEAGHLVPMDQPKAALQMLQSWMAGKLT